MKAKKALKRLNKVEKMLSDVLGGFSSIEKNVKDFLDSAKASVGRAREAMKPKPGPKTEKNTKPKTAEPSAAAAPAPKKATQKKAAPKKNAPPKPAPPKKKKPAPPPPPRKKKPVAKKKRRPTPKPSVHTPPAEPDLIEGPATEPGQTDTPPETVETHTEPVPEHEHLPPQE